MADIQGRDSDPSDALGLCDWAPSPACLWQILLTFQPSAGLRSAQQGFTLAGQFKTFLCASPLPAPSPGCPCCLPTDIPQVASPSSGHLATSCLSCQASLSFPWVPAVGSSCDWCFPRQLKLTSSQNSPFCPKRLKCHLPWHSDHLPHTQGTTPLAPQTAEALLVSSHASLV